MKAGRELDALIAERVLGWRRVRGSFAGTMTWNDRAVVLLPPGGIVTRVPRWTTEPITWFENIPRYSDHIEAAWSVIKELLGRGLYPDLVSSGRPVAWRCVIDSYSDPEASDDPWPVNAIADTPALAICIASLKALDARSMGSDVGTMEPVHP